MGWREGGDKEEVISVKRKEQMNGGSIVHWEEHHYNVVISPEITTAHDFSTERNSASVKGGLKNKFRHLTCL